MSNTKKIIVNKPVSKKKPVRKKKPASKKKVTELEKLFNNNEYKMLISNTLSFVDLKDKDLLNILNNVYSSIIRANNNLNMIDTNIMLLFSSIAEVYYLHKDRETRARQKKIMYNEWIDTYTAKISSYKEWIRLANENISSIINECKKEISLFEEKNKIPPTKQRKINDYKMLIQSHEQEILDLQQQIKACVRSQELKMFDVTKREKLTFDMTAQVISKNEKLLLLLKEFGVNPKIVGHGVLSNPSQNNTSGLFGGLNETSK